MTAQLEQTNVTNLNTPATMTDQECGDISTESPNNYAGAAGAGRHKLTFLLEAEKKNDFFVTVADVARLVYCRLDAPPNSLLEFDDVAYGKLTVYLRGEVDLGALNLTSALKIRDGLMTKPFKREIPEKLVNIYWAPATLSNEKIQEQLSKFGTINPHVGVMNKIYHAKPDDDDITKMMDGVILPDREVYMAVLLPIPSHILVDGVKIKIVYQGQPRTCARCFRYWGQCPGGGNSAECKKKAEEENKKKEEKGEKAKKAPSLKKKMNQLEKTLEEKMKIQKEKHEINVKNKPVPTLILISGLPQEITLAQMMNVFKKNNCDIENLDEKLELLVDSEGKGVGQASLTGLDEIDFELVNEQIDGAYVSGKRLKVTPVTEVTPKKPAAEEASEVPASPMDETSSSESSSARSGPMAAGASMISSLVKKFSSTEPPVTAGGSKVYSRITESGKEITSKKSARDEDDSSPKLSRGGEHNVSTRNSKKLKNNKNSNPK